ncbi:uncharacterized protein [Chaetodon trifascialis]|uniref:uncharacterized protein n=1 Tax=Chaetodon trifascialis TaxID=109706 RepID=UPI003992ED30
MARNCKHVGLSRRSFVINSRSGHDATLTCGDASSSETTCSIITWLYNRQPSPTFTEVLRGNIKNESGRAARLSLDTSCSLVINNITAEDVGFYTCRQGSDTDSDVNTYLNVLTISPSPADADPERDGEVTLQCSLLRYAELGPCEPNSIRWVDETGAVLRGEGVGYTLHRQMNCVSLLTVKHQSGHNRRYTCQVVNKENKVEVQAEYTPVFTGGSGDAEPQQPDSVTLQCSLLRYSERRPCEPNSIRWVDETGAVLRGEGVGYTLHRQMNCVSYLTVKHQSGHNRRYTCQVVNKENKVEVQAEYTPVFTGGSGDVEPEKPNSDSFLEIIIGAAVAMVVVLVVITAVLIRYRKRANVTEDVPDVQKPTKHADSAVCTQDDPENSLTYATVSHANLLACPQKKVKEEEVTYSTVKTAVKTEADSDPSSLYSYFP